jgi:hypothetical protein
MTTPSSTVPDATPTLSFEEFWDWLIRHPNCILRAGTQDAVIYDDEDYHWHFAVEGPDTPLVQVIRGKRLVSELLIAKERVAYVQGSLGDAEGEHLFDLVVEDENEQMTAYFFVLTHAYEQPETGTPGGVHSVH